MWGGDAGTSKTGTQGTRDVNDYRKSRRYMRYLFLRENVLFMVNIRFHLPKPHWTPYDVYTRFFIIGVSALTIVIRIRVNFHCRVIFVSTALAQKTLSHEHHQKCRKSLLKSIIRR